MEKSSYETWTVNVRLWHWHSGLSIFVEANADKSFLSRLVDFHYVD